MRTSLFREMQDRPGCSFEMSVVFRAKPFYFVSQEEP